MLDCIPLASFRQEYKNVFTFFFFWLYATELNLNHAILLQTDKYINNPEFAFISIQQILVREPLDKQCYS